MPPERRTGTSYMRGGVVACPKRRHASPGFGPLQVTATLPCVQEGTPRSPKTGVYACLNTFTYASGPVRCFGDIATPRIPPPTRIPSVSTVSPLRDTAIATFVTGGNRYTIGYVFLDKA